MCIYINTQYWPGYSFKREGPTLTKFNTQKNYFERRTLISSRFLLFFVNILTLYLHLTSTKNLKDLAGTRELKTKGRVKLQ